jgi:hypothetical protein
METLRQVIQLLYPGNVELQMKMFYRRRVMRGENTEPDEFRSKCEASKDIIKASMKRLVPLEQSGMLNKADQLYLGKSGPASVDIITDVVFEEYGKNCNAPPLVRRTKTPMFGSTVEDISIGTWEQNASECIGIWTTN